MRPQPFTTISIAVVVIVAYMFLAQFAGLPYWRSDISTELGIFENFLVSLIVIGLVSLANRERQRRRSLSSKVGRKWRCELLGSCLFCQQSSFS